jgi:hypothetical protein
MATAAGGFGQSSAGRGLYLINIGYVTLALKYATAASGRGRWRI